MEVGHSTLSRRNLLTVSGLAAGALFTRRASADVAIASPAIAPVSVAKVPSYGVDMVAQLELMFDQIGGVGTLMRNKTVAMKVNLSGASGSGRNVGLSAGQNDWVHPSVVGALTTVFF